jgi:hypothetical protein
MEAFQKPRSGLFVFLGVLTFIGNGVALFLNGITLLFIETIQEIMREGDVKDMMENVLGEGIFQPEEWEIIGNTMAAAPILSTIKLVAAVGSIVGVYMLFKGKSQGFIWYLTAQLLELVLPVLIVDKMGVPILGFVFTCLFLAVYFIESKRLSAIERQ